MNYNQSISRSFVSFLIVLNLAMTMIVGCNKNPDQANSTEQAQSKADDQIVIVTTTGMITDLVQRIVGDRATIHGLINSGIDPHLYQPTRSDIKSLLDADIVFYNGLKLEGKMQDAFDRVESTARVHAVTQQIDEDYLLSPPEYDGHPDPHVWMDPLAWALAAKQIRDAMIEFDPDGASIYESNARTLIREIEALHQYSLQVLGSVPESQRVLVTAHDAFSYFGRRYGYEVVGIQGISTESEAGVRDIERIVNLLVDRKISAVFVETTVSQRNIEALIAGAKARGHQVVIGGSLFSDAMGTSGTYEGTYIGMIDHNVSIIANALGGNVPDGGMNGKLKEVMP